MLTLDLREAAKMLGMHPNTLQVIPQLATYEETEPGKTYVFHIDADAKWSDGTPVTAREFSDELRRQQDRLRQMLGTDVGLPLDTRHVAYIGESFGTVVGTLFAAIEPAIDLYVLDVPGGGILDLLPGYADHWYESGATGLSWLVGAGGVGATLMSFWLTR